MTLVEGDTLVEEVVPLRNAMNEVLRDDYVEDCQRGVDRWNKTLEKYGLSERLRLPSRRFHRHIGAYAGHRFDPDGTRITQEEWDRRHGAWLPGAEDRAYVKSLMKPVTQPGRIAQWIAPRPRDQRPALHVRVRAARVGTAGRPPSYVSSFTGRGVPHTRPPARRRWLG